MTTYLQISARDPLVARDGRPFGAGQGRRMRSSGWPYPSVVAGSFRSALGKRAGRAFDGPTIRDLLAMAVAGVLPVADGELYLPAPANAVLGPDRLHRARPEELRTGEGCLWPTAGLRPVVLSDKEAAEDFKPTPGPAFWPLSMYEAWLLNREMPSLCSNCLAAPLPDLREHVCIEPGVGAAQEGLLFSTAGVAVAALPRLGAAEAPRADRFREVTLAARISNVPGWATAALGTLATLHPLGGERRLVRWEAAPDGQEWKAPQAVVDALGATKKVTMTLATPAVFRGGFKPDWLGNDLKGKPFAEAPTLRLVAVCCARWRAVSGWSYERKGPKAIRRLVPAGGVYFFEVESGTARTLGEAGWLRSVCDDEQERNDGFGLVVWGTW